MVGFGDVDGIRPHSSNNQLSQSTEANKGECQRPLRGGECVTMLAPPLPPTMRANMHGRAMWDECCPGGANGLVVAHGRGTLLRNHGSGNCATVAATVTVVSCECIRVLQSASQAASPLVRAAHSLTLLVARGLHPTGAQGGPGRADFKGQRALTSAAAAPGGCAMKQAAAAAARTATEERAVRDDPGSTLPGPGPPIPTFEGDVRDAVMVAGRSRGSRVADPDPVAGTAIASVCGTTKTKQNAV
jgi:hypothetical protein